MARGGLRQVGEIDGPLEDRLDQAFDRTVAEGEQRLGRSFRDILITGAVAGMEVSFGVLALLAVQRATHSPLLAGLAFSVGFLALLLGHSELFTEGFLIPVTTVVAQRATVTQLAKLWLGTLVANLVGGWFITWLLMTGYPDLHATAVTSAKHFATAPFSARSVALAVIAGAAITLMTRMQHGTDSMAGKIAATIAGAFLLAGLQMFHSILDSLLIFSALHGQAPFGYADWARWFSYTVVGNLLGGVLLVTVLRLLRSSDRLQQERSNDQP